MLTVREFFHLLEQRSRPADRLAGVFLALEDVEAAGLQQWSRHVRSGGLIGPARGVAMHRDVGACRSCRTLWPLPFSSISTTSARRLGCIGLPRMPPYSAFQSSSSR